MKQPKRIDKDERGLSLVEALIGLVILTVVLLSLAASAGLAIRQTTVGRMDMQLWAAVQWTMDSLVARGAGNVTNGSAVVQGFPMTWTTDLASPELITLEVTYVSVSSRVTLKDTLTMYLSN